MTKLVRFGPFQIYLTGGKCKNLTFCLLSRQTTKSPTFAKTNVSVCAWAKHATMATDETLI